MCPPSGLDVHVTRSPAIAPIRISGGTTGPVFSTRYLRNGVWHHFVYQTPDRGDTCLQKYLDSIGLGIEDVIVSSPNWNTGQLDLDMRPEINPRFSRVGVVEVVVEYKRGGITHWFEFPDTLESSALQSYIESIGLSVFNVKVTVLTVPEVDFLDLV